MARDLKFQVKEVEGVFYLCSENKGTDQLTLQPIRAFVFAYAKSRSSNDTALKEGHLSIHNIRGGIKKFVH